MRVKNSALLMLLVHRCLAKQRIFSEARPEADHANQKSGDQHGFAEVFLLRHEKQGDADNEVDARLAHYAHRVQHERAVVVPHADARDGQVKKHDADVDEHDP